MSAPFHDFRNAERIFAAIRRAQQHLRPPPNLLPSDYAEHNVSIPDGNAIPGLIDFGNAPYQREPLDMTVNPACRRISMMWGAQVGKTTVALCAQAFRIENNPSNQMMMQPSQSDLEKWLRTKFDPLVDSNSTLQKLIATPRARNGVNNTKMKSYPGGFLVFAWAGSPRTMRGVSAPFIVCDEVDGYDRTGEGHPVSLLWQRAASFESSPDACLIEISTPTIKGDSYIEGAFEAGDQRRFNVPCPHCGHMQALTWSNVTWDKSEDGTHLPETAGYVCSECGTVWTNADRVAAIRDPRAVWIAAKPFRGHASYHLSELYSCMRTLAGIVQSFLDKKAANDLQTFVNVSLAETWEEEGEKADAATMIGRVEKYRAPVPMGAVYLTAGVDMQQDRIEVEVVGWGLGEESWSIEHRVIWGDVLQSDVWDQLDAMLQETWRHESGAEMSLGSVCLDTGGTNGMTQAAYEYARGKTGRKLFPIKGTDGWGKPIVSQPSWKRTGQGQRRVHLWAVGVDEAKMIVMRRWAQTAIGAGYCHYPDDRDAEWFAQACAEKLVTKYLRGFPKREWHKTRPRNEALDCRVYAYAALKITNPNLARLAEKFAPLPDDPDTKTDAVPNPADPAPEAQPDKPRQGRKKKFARTTGRVTGGGW